MKPQEEMIPMLHQAAKLLPTNDSHQRCQSCTSFQQYRQTQSQNSFISHQQLYTNAGKGCGCGYFGHFSLV